MKVLREALVLLCFAFLVFPLSTFGVARAVVSPSSYQVLLEDNFMRGLGKWKPLQGAWTIQNGTLRGSSTGAKAVICTGDAWTDYVFSARVKSITNSSDVLFVRLRDLENYYRVVLLWDHMEIWLRRDGIDQLLFRQKPWGYSISTMNWHEIKVRIYGTPPTITAYWDDYPEMTIKDLSNRSLSSGMVGLGSDSGAESEFEKVKVTTLHPDSTGVQRAILLLIEFPDIKHHLTPQEVYNNVFPQLNQYYTEVSYNLTWIVGRVTPAWRTLQKPSTYYDVARVTGSGWRNGRDQQFLRDSILAWDSEVDYRNYDYVFVCGAGSSVWGYTYFQLNITRTNDGITIDRATAQPENDDWMVYAHEFGHIALGLPDLYSYQIAYGGPADWREAAVYDGPWDLMSRSNERPQIGAWGKMHVGWISPNRLLEILPGQGGRANLEPLEKTTSGTQAIVIYLNSSTYFIVENREPIGHDSVLPDEGVLVSYVDEGKYWHGNGPVVIQDANPENLSRWQLPHPTLKIGPGAKSEYVNQTYNLVVSLLGKTSDNSYIVDVSRQGQTKTQTQSLAACHVQLLGVAMAVVVVAAIITVANRMRKKEDR